MSNTSDQPSTLSRGVDHLGALATTLRDLAGPQSIINELTQNADDAVSESGHATKIRFTLTPDHLEVWNDGVFSDCGDQRPPTCSWKAAGGSSCDLHAFRLFAGRNKSHDSAKTGAFGVGFTAVYQLTDRPELLTGSRHWILNEAASEGARVTVCKDQACGRNHGGSGTTFVLPWAREQSSLRTGLGVPPVTDNDIRELERTLRGVGEVLLFLKRVRSIESVTSEGRRVFTRSLGHHGPVISTEHGASTRWLIVNATLGTEADRIVAESRGLIDPDRDREVAVALQLDASSSSGLLYAGLPTRSVTGFKGHVNASFFPRTDRKGVRFDSDPESDWNRLALRTAAHALAVNADVVLDAVGPHRFWGLLAEVEHVRQRAQNLEIDPTFIEFATQFARAVPELPSVATEGGGLLRPGQVLLPRSPELYDDAQVLESIGIPLVSRDLHGLVHATRYTDFGVTTIAAKHIVETLKSTGVVEPFVLSDGPLTGEEVRGILRCLSRLLGARRHLERVPDINDVAIIPCRNARVAPASQSVVADANEAALFERIDPCLPIVDTNTLNEQCPALASICPELSLARAADILGRQRPSKIQGESHAILEWLDGRSGDLSQPTADEFARLPIYPSSGGAFRPLTQLSLRSGFTDPLKIAALIDDDVVEGHTDLLRKLGAAELDVVEYFRVHVIPRTQASSLPYDMAFAVLEVAANSRARLDTAGLSLGDVEIVPCEDDELHRPLETYLPSPDVRLLAHDEPIAVTEGLSPHVLDALAWLGVAEAPRHETLIAAAERLAAENTAPDPKVAAALLRAVHNALSDETQPTRDLQSLSQCAWLPVRTGGRATPSEVLPTNQRQLYGAQGNELGLPAGIQNDYFRTLEKLGMPRTPPTELIAAHLRDCAENGVEVRPQVYAALSHDADSPHVRALAGVACIQLSTPGRYAAPNTVFWQSTPFARWAHQLSPDRRPQQDFYDAVGVNEVPGPREIESVLEAIADEFASSQLDSAAKAVVHECWAALDTNIEAEQAGIVLGRLKTKRAAPNARGILVRPSTLFFRDSRGVSDRFTLLTHDVIRRDKATWRALAVAGVRRAEEIFTIEPHELSPQPDRALPAVLSDRRDALLRVLEGHTNFAEEPLDLDDLSDLEVAVTDSLTVQYRAVIGSQVEMTDPVHVDAIYLPDQHRLVYRPDGRPREVARELSHALDLDGDTAYLALAIEQVLTAESLDDAHDALSAYGIADLMATDFAAVMSDTIDDPYYADEEWFDHAQSPHNDSPGKSAADNDSRDGEGGRSRAPNGTTSQPQGENAQASSRRQGQGERPDVEDTRRKQTRRAPSGRQERLRSYVVYGDEGDRGTRGDEAPDRSPTDAAGIERVLSHERSVGRKPREMPHDNPGFDIESFDKRGELVRRIEVKSTRSEWSVMGVMLSRRQLEQARSDGDLYWLYIVEHAENDPTHEKPPKVHRVQDPASRIGYFGFDDGWRSAAEPNLPRDEHGELMIRETRRNLRSSLDYDS